MIPKRVGQVVRGNSEDVQATKEGAAETSGEGATQPAQIDVVPATETTRQSADEELDGPL